MIWRKKISDKIQEFFDNIYSNAIFYDCYQKFSIFALGNLLIRYSIDRRIKTKISCVFLIATNV